MWFVVCVSVRVENMHSKMRKVAKERDVWRNATSLNVLVQDNSSLQISKGGR